MGATWTSSGWCPPAVDGQRYCWTVSFEPAGAYWSTQSSLIGGSPAGMDLEATLTDWFQRRGGPAARWRLQVSPEADESTILAEVVLTFTKTVEREVKRLGPARGPIAPTFWTSTLLLPPSAAQLRAWAARADTAGDDQGVDISSDGG